MTFLVLPTYFNLVNKLPNNISSLILIGVAFAAAGGALSLGELSQHLGRKKVLVAMGVIRIVAFPFLFLAMAKTDSVAILAIYALMLAFIANGSYGPLLIFLNERFPTALRAQCRALSPDFPAVALAVFIPWPRGGDGIPTGARDGTRAEGGLDRGRRRLFSF